MNLPKKLNTWTKTKKIGEDYLVLWESVVEIKQKQDEIIDYLSDKEEASLEAGLKINVGEEASKGEVKSDDSKTNEPDYTHCGHCGVKFGDEDNPELHDIHCWNSKSHPPQQEESPKEDEWKELSDLIHDAIYGGEVRGVDVIQRVNEKFILKSKVNKAIDGRLFIRPELDEFEKGCNMASRGIRRSLGLEEL